MKKIMLLSIAFVLFSCGGAEMKKDDARKEAKEEYTEAPASENVAGGYSEDEMDMDDMPAENGPVNQTSTMNYDRSKMSNKDLKKVTEEDGQVEVELPKNIIDSKIIKTANMKFQVLDVDESTSQIRKIIKSKGAYISDMNQSKNRNHFYSEITIRVPSAYFDDVLFELSLTGEKVDYKRITSQDVTEEYVDIQTRLKTKKEVKRRYEEILRSRAKTISEILDTEEKLRRLQEEIEAQEGRLRYLHNQTSMSTIYLTIYEEGVDLDEVEKQKKFSERANKGFASGWDAILNVVVALTYMWPGLLITLFILIWQRRLIRRIIRGTKRAFETKETPKSEE